MDGVKQTAAVLIVKSWNGHRVGATVVTDADRAAALVELGVARLIVHGNAESKTPDKPMNKRSK